VVQDLPNERRRYGIVPGNDDMVFDMGGKFVRGPAPALRLYPGGVEELDEREGQKHQEQHHARHEHYY